MLIRDGKEYRNLQQQVAENTDDIAELKQGGVVADAYTKEEADAKFATKTECNSKLSRSNLTDYSINDIIVADSEIQSGEVELRAVSSQDVNSEVSLDPTSVIIKTSSGLNNSTIGVSGTEINLTASIAKYNSNEIAVKSDLSSKQDTLVSGTNIKTINGNSVLGSGDIIIGEGGTTVTGGNGIIVSNEGEISIDTSVVAELSDIPTVPTKTSQLTNDSDFITGINSTDVITALGYTPGTSNFSGDYDDLTDKPTLFSGDYNDLTNKPTIPAAVSGTNDGTNWTSLTIGNDTYGLASGGGSSTHLYRHTVSMGGVTNSKGYYIVVTLYTTDSGSIDTLPKLLAAFNDGTAGYTGTSVICTGLIAQSSSTSYRPSYLHKNNDKVEVYYMYLSGSNITTGTINIASTDTSFTIYDNVGKIY